MNRNTTIAMLFAWLFVAGCGGEPQSAPRQPAAAEPPSKDDVLRAIADAERQAAATIPPAPAFALPDVGGWVRSDPRPLPPDDHGFTVAYDHPTRVAVTLYQYTRGLANIPEDLDSEPVQAEMKRAKTGIEQAITLGLWKAAKETDQGIVPLGESDRKALRCRYRLTTENGSVTSDIYIWSYANTLFKLRCTDRGESPEAEERAVAKLLTAIGNACSPK